MLKAFSRFVSEFFARRSLPPTAYRAILRREPTSAEVYRKELRSLGPGGRFNLLRDMVNSDEFRLQILPGLVVASTKFTSTSPVFFLHVPKTGGTSVRLALSDALGIPPLNIYGAWPTPDQHKHAFWPLWAGHAQINFFPDSHQGFTVFREPRSQILSGYRQKQFLASGGRKHGWDYPIKRRQGQDIGFDHWLQSSGYYFQWFIPHPDRSVRRWSPEEVKRMSDEPEQDLRKQISAALARFKSAAWLHEEKSVLDAIQQVAGRAPERLPFENPASGKGLDLSPVNVSGKALARINLLANLNRIVIEQAVNRGLIPELNEAEADRQFHKTAAKLKFNLPEH